ncbi:MAG TPA: HAD-IA family hydrolase [Bryobacteraceae bacterium]|nr:HAD-IA family hydrolase [Bryobacteraceae bacterium]
MLIIFDLDGTLIDSSKDLVISVNAMRDHLGLAPLDPLLIHSYVGNGAPMLVKRSLGPAVTNEMAERGLAYFLKYYRTHALQHTRCYDGIPELLRDLWAEGHKMAILTNKPAKISTDIVAGLGISQYFFRIYGGDSLFAKKPDPEGIRLLMEESDEPPVNTLMVGDSAVDVRTARNAGVRCCGVTWGIQPESFELNPPDFLIQSPRELRLELEVG